MRSERGEMSLVGLLVAMTLFLGVLGATLATFNRSETLNRQVQGRSDAQGTVRAAADVVARELRNVRVAAGDPVPSAHDLVARQVNAFTASGTANTAGASRVRVCLDDGGVLWRMRQTWTTAVAPASPSTAGCPGTGWAGARRVASGVRNKTAAVPVATFAFDDPAQPASVRLSLVLDEDTARAPGPVALSTGVFLRNQNKAPGADFAATPVATGGVVLNATSSADPEGERLSYVWKDGAAVIAGCSAITCTYDPPGSMSRSVTLEVTDVGGATATATKAVTA